MPERRPRFRLALSSLVVLLLLGACGGPTTLPSRSGAKAPSVDAALGDWGGSLRFVGDESVRMSAEPTDSLLYVAVIIQDRRLIRSIAKNGLIVWVDPTGGQQRTYGIQYPLGLERQKAQQAAPEAAAADQEQEVRAVDALDRVSLAQLEIIRNDSTRNRIPAQFSSGLRAKAALNPGSLIYELAIPVEGSSVASDRGQQHGLRTTLASTIGLGLEVRKDDEETNLLATDRGGATPSVTGRGGRRGRQGRRGRRRRQRQQEKSQKVRRPELPTLEVWTRVVRSTGN